MSTKLKNKKKRNQFDTGYNFFLLPLTITITIIPLIVRYYTYKTNLDTNPWFSWTDYTDFFLFWKSAIFSALAGIMAILIVVKLIRDKRNVNWSPIFIPLFIYGILALVSTIFSEYSSFGYTGIYEQFESIWVVLGYCIITYYAYLYVNTIRDVEKVIKWLIIGVCVMIYIGFTQAFTKDFFQTQFAGAFMLPRGYDIENLTFNFEPGRVYLSLYNPNYVGSYVALIAPIFLVLIFSVRKLRSSIFYSVLVIGLVLCLFASQSRSGIVAMAFSLILLALLLRKQFITRWKVAVAALVTIVASFVLINILTGNTLVSKVLGIFSPSKSIASLESIETNDENVEVVYKGNTVYITYDYDDASGTMGFNALDDADSSIEMVLSEDASYYTITDERFPFTLTPIKFDPEDRIGVGELIGMGIKIDDTQWYFTNQIDGTYYYYTGAGYYDKINNADSVLLTDYASFASGRGYIWSRTLPLLKDYFFLGSGADSFVLAFPNDDYVGKGVSGYNNMIITRPHNMYLQIGVQSGTLSLIAILVFYLMYFIQSIKIYWNNKYDSYISWVGVGIFIGTVGYMIVGIINDSSVTVAPVFWALIGVGAAINRLISKPAA